LEIWLLSAMPTITGVDHTEKMPSQSAFAFTATA